MVTMTRSGTGTVTVVTVTEIGTGETATGTAIATETGSGSAIGIETMTAALAVRTSSTTTTGKGGLGRRIGRGYIAGEWIGTLPNFPMVTRDLAHLIAEDELTTMTWAVVIRGIQRFVPPSEPCIAVVWGTNANKSTQRLKREVSRERSPHRETRLKSKTPQPPPKEKSPSIRAGSEEGEIEED
jgi:hypothetical protein